MYLRFSILGMLLWAQHTSEDQTGKIALSLNGGYILFFLGGMLHSPELLMIPIFLLIYGNANFIKHIKGDEPYLFSNVGSLLIMTVCFATIFLMKSRYAIVQCETVISSVTASTFMSAGSRDGCKQKQDCRRQSKPSPTGNGNMGICQIAKAIHDNKVAASKD